MQHTSDTGNVTTMSDSDTSTIGSQLGLLLQRYYPQIVEVDAETLLGRVLGRLTAALDAAAVAAVPPAFKDELLGVVPRLRRYAMSLTHDATAADDLVQLTLLRAWEFRDRFEPGTNLVGWLFTILRNGHLNGRRKYWREVADPEGLHAGTLAEPARQDHTVDLQDLQTALSRLDPAHREALTLVTVEGLTYDAAAAIIGCPAGTVKSRVSRARERLSHELGIA